MKGEAGNVLTMSLAFIKFDPNYVGDDNDSGGDMDDAEEAYSDDEVYSEADS